MSQETTKPKLTCETCNTSFSTAKEEQEHQFSLMHHIRMDQAPRSKKKKKGFHRCCLCSVDIQNLDSYVSHLGGKKHKSNLDKFHKGLKKLETNTDSSQERAASPKGSKKSNNTTNSNQSNQVPSPVTNLTNKKIWGSSTSQGPFNGRKTLLSETERYHANKNKSFQSDHAAPSHITPQTSNSCDSYNFNKKMQCSTDYDFNNYTIDDPEYYDGWNFTTSCYPDYSQNYFVGNDWDQQNHNYWWNKQSSWYNREWNDYSQRDRMGFQCTSDMSNYIFPPNHYRNYNNHASQTFNNTFNARGNYNRNRYWQRMPYLEDMTHQKCNEAFVNNQIIHSENNQEGDQVATEANENKCGGGKPGKNNRNFNGCNKGIKTRNNSKHVGSNNKTDVTTLVPAKKSSLKPKVKSLVKKFKPKPKDLESNSLNENKKANKVAGQKRISRCGKSTPSSKKVKPSIAANVPSNKHTENAKNDAHAVGEVSEVATQSTKPTSNNDWNESSDIVHSTKLYRLSKIIEESKVEICSFDKELINKLVNFPRTRKEQLRLEKWIQEHSKTKKKLTFPRFNLPLYLTPSQKSRSDDSSAFLHSVVSEVVNNLAEGVIDSLLLAIKNVEGDVLHSTAEESGVEHSTQDSSKCYTIMSEYPGQLSHAEKIQWLQNWITEAGKPQNRNTCHSQETSKANQNRDIIAKDIQNGANANREQTTNFNSSSNICNTCDEAHEDFLQSSQKDGNNILSMPELQTEDTSRQIPKDGDIAWKTRPVKCENDTIEQDQDKKIVPVHNPENEKALPMPFRIQEPENSVAKNTPHLSPSWASDVSKEVPLNISRNDSVMMDGNIPGIAIKTEPLDTYENEPVKEREFCSNQNMNANYDEVNSGRTKQVSRDETAQTGESAGTASLDAMINTFVAGSAKNGSPSATLEYVKDMLSKNKILLQQITQLLNSHVEQPNTTEPPNQTLIQELLQTSQKEEELRQLGLRIDRIISYFFRFGEEWKAKRTQAFYEEMRLRTRRMQLLERLQGQISKNQDLNNKTGENLASCQPGVQLSHLNVSDSSSANETLPSSTQILNMPTPSENGNGRPENSILTPNNNCANSLNKTITKGTKRKQPHKNSSSPLSVDPTNIQVAEKSTDSKMNPPKRKRTVRTTTAKRKKVEESATSSKKATSSDNYERTLAEENERFWAEIDAWIRDMDFNSQPPANQEFKKHEEESEPDWLQHNTIPSAENSTRPTSDSSSLSSQDSLLTKEIPCAVNNIEAHNSPVTDITVHDGHLYTCSSDGTAKRFDLKDPTNITVFSGHQKIVTSLRVIDLGNNKAQLFTSSMDGHLRCFDSMSGDCLYVEEVGFGIICTALDWGKIYLGLPTGAIAIYNVTVRRITDSFQCSKCAIGCISTSSEGAQKILCVSSYDSAVTIWDATTGLLLRCLEGQAKPPCKVRISGNLVFTSTNKKTVLIHSISSGKLQKVLNWPTSATGLHVSADYIISCSFDGMIRLYTRKGWMLHALYYGAGKSSVLSLCVYNDWIFTGNRNGMVEAFKFIPHSIVPCQFGKCYFRFGRLEDLRHHVKTCHFSKVDDNLQSCPWRGCNVQFILKTNQEKEDHLFQHVNGTSMA